MQSLDIAARRAGMLYLSAILIGPFSLIYVPRTLVVSGNANATAQNVLAHEMLLRFGIAGDVLVGIVFLFTTIALYRLLCGVDRALAVVMVILGGILPAPIFLLNALNWAAALLLIHGAGYLAAFTRDQQFALAMVFIRLHALGNGINSLLWGLWLFPFGLLVVRSRFLPRLIGYFLIVEGVAYVIVSLTGLLAPQWQDAVSTVVSPAFFAEIAIALWLLTRGAKPNPSSVTAS